VYYAVKFNFDNSCLLQASLMLWVVSTFD